MANCSPFLLSLLLLGIQATAATPGSVDTSFVPQLDPKAGTAEMIVAPDGKLYLAGSGLATIERQSRNIVRLLPDGTLDTSFRVSLGGISVAPYALVLDRTGRLLTSAIIRYPNPAGPTLPPIASARFVGFTSTGQLDTEFNQKALPIEEQSTSRITALAEDEAGHVLVSGIFGSLGGAAQTGGLARLLDDGSADLSFSSAGTFSGRLYDRHQISSTAAGGIVHWLGATSHYSSTGALSSSTEDEGYTRGFIDTQGRIVAANGNSIRRYLADGTLDASFSYTGANALGAVLPGPNGSTIVMSGSSVVRLDAQGAVDSAFQPPAFSGSLAGVAVDARGDVYVFGSFSAGGTATTHAVARLSGGYGTVINLDPIAPAGEQSGARRITARRVGDLTQAAEVTIATSSGTATSGADFVPLTGTLSFAAGQETAAADVEVLDDVELEGDETFTVTLSNPTSGVLGTDARRGASITRESAGTVSLPTEPIFVTDSAREVEIPISRSGGAEGPLTFRLVISSSAPLAGNRQTTAHAEKELTLAPGSTGMTVKLPLRKSFANEDGQSINVYILPKAGETAVPLRINIAKDAGRPSGFAYAGTYRGIDEHEGRPLLLNLTITGAGRVIATLGSGAVTRSIPARLLSGGYVWLQMRTADGASREVTFVLEGSPGAASLVNLAPAGESGARTVLHSGGDFQQPAVAAGLYTFALPPLAGEGQPPGWSWGAIEVRPSGIVLLRGRLAGARPFTASGRLSADGRVVLSTGAGPKAFLGLDLVFASNTVSGTARWTRAASKAGAFPASIDERVTLSPSAKFEFSAVADATALTYQREGASAAVRLTRSKNTATYVEFTSERTALRLLSDGRFSGREGAGPQAVTFSGVWLAGEGRGVGAVTAGTQAAVALSP